MWIPTHYVVLFIAILLCESAVLFVYTIIGLIKQNPMPFLFPPPVPEYPLCQYAGAFQPRTVNEGFTPMGDGQPEQPMLNIASTTIVTSTSIIQMMLSTSVDGQVSTNSPAQVSLLNTLSSTARNTPTPSASQDSTTLISIHSASTSSSSDTDSSASRSSLQTSSQTSSPSSSQTSLHISSKPSVTSSPPISTHASSTSSSESMDISTFTNKDGVVTSIIISTTTLPVKTPPVTSLTSIVVLPAPKSSSK